MKLTKKQLKELIKECACQAMKDAGMDRYSEESMPSVKVISLPKMKSELFPSMHGMDDMHHQHDDLDMDDQGEKSMILANLKKIAERAAELQDLVAEVPDNEEWVQEKIAVAASMITSIYDYLKYSEEE